MMIGDDLHYMHANRHVGGGMVITVYNLRLGDCVYDNASIRLSCSDVEALSDECAAALARAQESAR